MSPVLLAPLAIGGVGVSLLAFDTARVFVQEPERLNATPGAIVILVLVGIAILLVTFALLRYLTTGVQVANSSVLVRNLRNSHRVPVEEVQSAKTIGSTPYLVLGDGEKIGLTGLRLWTSKLSEGKYVEEGLTELRNRIEAARQS